MLFSFSKPYRFNSRLELPCSLREICSVCNASFSGACFGRQRYRIPRAPKNPAARTGHTLDRGCSLRPKHRYGFSSDVRRVSRITRGVSVEFDRKPEMYDRMLDQAIDKTIYESIITCPNCGFRKTEEMPTDSCVFFYECARCHQLLKPNAGDCCVFCSFGSSPCPPKTIGQSCC